MQSSETHQSKAKSRAGRNTKPAPAVAIPEIPAEHVDAILKLDNQLCFALYAASRLVVQSYTPLLAELGLTYLQYLVLLALWEKDGLTVKELGHLLFLDSGTLTPVLAKMADGGFIRRKRAAADDRRVENFLTEKSRNLKLEAVKVPVTLFCQSGMSLEETAALRDTLRGLLARVEQH